MPRDVMPPLELHPRLSEACVGENGRSASPQRPLPDIAMEREELLAERVHLCHTMRSGSNELAFEKAVAAPCTFASRLRRFAQLSSAPASVFWMAPIDKPRSHAVSARENPA